MPGTLRCLHEKTTLKKHGIVDQCSKRPRRSTLTNQTLGPNEMERITPPEAGRILWLHPRLQPWRPAA